MHHVSSDVTEGIPGPRMSARGVSLFCFCLLFHCASANDAVDSTAGNAGDGGAGNATICSEVPHAEDGEVEPITSSTAYTAVSCHLSCMEEVANSSEFLNARFISGSIAGVWSYHVFPEFDAADRQSTCPAYKKFRECQRGCLVRTHQNKTTLTKNQCKRDCRDECVDSKRTNSQYNAYCEVDCSASNCLLGCKKYSNIQRSQNTSTTPHGPVAAPVLVSSVPGLFKVNLTNSAPVTGTPSPVGFVYRIEDQLTGATVFLSQVDPTQSLSLTQFPCRKVLVSFVVVSFVVVNKYGASTESPATTIILPVNDAADSTASNAAPDSRPSEDGISRDPDEETGAGSESGEWESASGSGSGSGGDGGAGDVVTCSEVPHAEDGEVELITSSAAYTAVSCHLSCMEEVANSSEFTNARFKSGSIAGVWPYFVFPKFDVDDRRSTCPAYKKFRECLRGCLVRTHQNKTTLTKNQCKRDCRDECVDSRRTNSQYNAYCEVDCSASNCFLGCKKHSSIQRSQNTLTTPHGPVAAPVLVSSVPGFFKVNLTNSAPATGTLSPVGFVYRIEDQLTGATVFLSQVDPAQSLNLTQFPCQTLLVSFVVVNKYGASTESPAVTIIIPEKGLKPPTIQDISTVMDTRLGFFGYGVVTVSWQHPLSIADIDYYIVKVLSLSGDGNSHSSGGLHPHTTSLTMKAEEKDSIFVLGTRYDIEVCSVSKGKEKCARRYYGLPTVKNSGTSVLQIASCTSQWNGTQFNYIVEWTIPDFIAFADGIVHSFILGANLLHNGKPQLGFRSKVAHKQVNQTRYTHTWTSFDPQPSAYTYKFSVSIHWAEGPYCCEVVSDDCSIQAVPPPSSPVLNVTISAITFPEGNIQFDFSWKPPSSTNGDVTEYLACLSSRVLEDEEDPPHYGSDDLTCVNTNKMSTSHTWNTRIPHPECLFFQMRAHTQYRKGLWSKEDVISTKPYDRMRLECHVIEGSTSDSSAIEVSWTVQNGTLCSHLEDASLERLNITLEAAVKGSSLMSKLGSVTLPMGRGKYTFGNISMASSSQYLVMLQASWKGIKFYEDALISVCIEEQPVSPAPAMASVAVVVPVSVTVAIVGAACLALLCVLCIMCLKKKRLRHFVKPNSIEFSAVNAQSTNCSSLTPPLKDQDSLQCLSSTPAARDLPRPLSPQHLPDIQNSDPYTEAPLSVTPSSPEWPSGLRKQASEGSLPAKITETKRNGSDGEGGGEGVGERSGK